MVVIVKSNNVDTTCIYKIVNNITGKTYVGQTKNYRIRMNGHRSSYNNPNSRLYNMQLYKDMREIGIENFSFEIIEECNEDELLDKERYWTEKLDTFYNGYNNTLAGDCKLGCLYDYEEFEQYFNNHKEEYSNINFRKELGISKTQVNRLAKKAGYVSRFYLTANEEQTICNDYISDLNVSCNKLAKKYKRDPETISRILKKNNIEIRPTGSSKALKIKVYDHYTNEEMITYTTEFYKYLKDNNIVNNPILSTIQNHIEREGNLLYKRFTIRKIKEEE